MNFKPEQKQSKEQQPIDTTSTHACTERNVIRRLFENFSNAAKFSSWAFRNPLTVSASNFKMLSDLLGLIMIVSKEDKHKMTHIAFVHPLEGEQQIVSIWAGAGMDSDPTKRISELIKENSMLKAELSKRVVVAENGV